MVSAGGASTATYGGSGAVIAAEPLTDTATTPVTFVCCVESGALEEQAVRLVASIRKWGGTLAACPILAITPRLGPPLRHETRRVFDEMEVTYIRQHLRKPYNWFKFMAKPRAMSIAEECATTDLIVWLDSDVLVIDEPFKFRLPDDVDIGACALSRHGGTTGPGDTNEPWWRAMCEAVDLSVDDLPWITTWMDEQRVRLYFNAGIFAYRRSSKFLETFEDCVCRILDARISSQKDGILFVDQAALGLAVVRLGLHYQAWPQLYNFNVGHGIEKYYQSDLMREARVLHYHNYMKSEAWPRFMQVLKQDRPAVAEWLAPLGPVDEPRIRRPYDMLRSAFKAYRRFRTTWFERAQGRPV